MNMKHFTCIFILLFYILNISHGNIIKGQQWIYSYKGHIDAKSSPLTDSLARWSVSGKLTGQSFDKYMVFQLENLKTNLYNGDINDFHNSEEKDIPPEAEILYKPFVVHQTNDGLTIDVTPNEPLWSLNMKRAIGSHFQINFEQGFDGEFIEQSIYGDCQINYISDKIGKDIIVNKFINHKKCKNNPFKHKTNVFRPEAIKDYNPLQIETVKKYFLKDVNSILVVSDTYSTSNITYRSMPSIPNTQNIDQYQEFKMISQSKIEKLINTNENTEKHNIIYEIDMESLYGRSKRTQNPEEQIKELIRNYDAFGKEINSTLINFDMHKEDYVENMFLSLSDMKTETLLKLNEQLKKREDLFNVTIFTLLPYIGTKETTNFIIELLKDDLSFEDEQYLGVKFFATFPGYIWKPMDQTLKSLEILLDYKLSSKPFVKNAAVLSFASIVQNAMDQNSISEATFESYKSLFYTKFINEELYETRMVYLLTLVNIGKSLTPEFIIPILTNTSESNHLRALGISGFKKYLIHESEKVFSNFWPIVQNETEAFDVRASALDLLLSSNLNENQFNIIVDVYKKRQKGVFNQHLFHYFHTTMQLLQNSTRFTDPLGALATDLFQKEDFPEYRLNYDACPTTNFRLSYTDEEPNFGRSLQARLFANPITNSFNIVQLSYNYFAMSFDMGTYGLYLKFDKFFEVKYRRTLNELIEDDLSLPDLLKIIEDFKIKMKTEDFRYHIEGVVFINNQAITALHHYPGRILNISVLDQSTIFNDLQEKRISYPLIDYIAFPSDLGTSITVKNDVQDVTSGISPKMDINVRNNWYYQTWLESYNPIVGTPISSYKYYGKEMSVNFTMDIRFDTKLLSFSLYHWNDSFQMVNDKIIGTSVEDKEILNKYCPICDNYYDISNDDYVHERIKKFDLLTVALNTTLGARDVFPNTSHDFFKSHYSNANNLVIAKPLLLLWHYFDADYYFDSDLERDSYRSIPYFLNTTMTLIKIKNNKDDNKINPTYASSYINVSAEFSSSSTRDEEVKLHWETSYTNQITTININGTEKPKMLQTFDFDYVIYNESRRIRIDAEREVIYPKINSDKFSIIPAEPATGNTVMRFCKIPENAEDFEDVDSLSNCSSIKLREKFWVSDELKNSVLESNDYKTCKNEKIGFEFTPATKSCVLYTHRPMYQYDNYEMYTEIYNFSRLPENITFAEPSISYKFPKKNKMNLLFLNNELQLAFEFTSDDAYWNVTFDYFQILANPNAIAYNDVEVLVGTKKSCIITPNKIKTLTGDILQFDEKKPVALIECYRKSLRGLTIQKINNKNIGFKFWALTNTLVVTVVDGKLKINLNGNYINETFYDEENKFKITFVAKNVILVDDPEIQIYYNTEYIYTKMSPMYDSRLCGFCSSGDNHN